MHVKIAWLKCKRLFITIDIPCCFLIIINTLVIWVLDHANTHKSIQNARWAFKLHTLGILSEVGTDARGFRFSNITNGERPKWNGLLLFVLITTAIDEKNWDIHNGQNEEEPYEIL